MTDSAFKLLITAYDYRPSLGGVATFGYELARAMSRQQGVEVKVLSKSAPGADVADAHGLFQTTRVALPSRGTLAVPGITAAMTAEIAKWRPSAILNFLWVPEGAASLAVSPLRGVLRVPYFVIAHGMEVMESTATVKKSMRRALLPLKREVFARATEVFAVSDFTRTVVLKETGLDPERVQVIHPGVDLLAFAPRTRLPSLVARHGLQGKTVFFTLARLLDYKGVDRVISAIRHLKARSPENASRLKYLIAGDGPDRSRLESLVRHHRLQNTVIFTGPVPADEMADYYSLCDCFVLCTRSDLGGPNVEGFGLVFLEAAAVARPSIGGRSGGIPNAIVDGETGWLVDPDNEEEIARALQRVVENPELAVEFGERARKRILSGMGWDDVARRMLAKMRPHVRN